MFDLTQLQEAIFERFGRGSGRPAQAKWQRRALAPPTSPCRLRRSVWCLLPFSLRRKMPQRGIPSLSKRGPKLHMVPSTSFSDCNCQSDGALVAALRADTVECTQPQWAMGGHHHSAIAKETSKNLKPARKSVLHITQFPRRRCRRGSNRRGRFRSWRPHHPMFLPLRGGS